MFYYRVTHKYMLFDHIEKKDIGIYSSLEKANMEINLLQDKNGFKETKDCFFVKKVFKFTKPKLLDKTFWIDGFDTYYYVENMSKKISCDETRHIMKHFSFFIKEYWNIFIGLFSVGAIIAGFFLGDSKGVVLSISISIFASWLLFFLADFLPTKIRSKKAFAYVKPKLKSIYDEINHIDDILCFYINISVEQKIEKKAEAMKHIFSIDKTNVYEEVFYKIDSPLRLNHDIDISTIEGCTKTILNRITEMEKFWSYLPLEIVKSVENIRENCELKGCMSPINTTLGTIKGILQNSENHVLENKYKILMKEINILEKYGFIRIKRTITKDQRTDLERKLEIDKALAIVKGENK